MVVSELLSDLPHAKLHRSLWSEALDFEIDAVSTASPVDFDDELARLRRIARRVAAQQSLPRTRVPAMSTPPQREWTTRDQK